MSDSQSPVAFDEPPLAPERYSSTVITTGETDLSPSEQALSNAAKETKHRSALREIVETVLVAALIFLLVRTLVLNFRVDGHSMDTTLQNGEMLIVNRNSYVSFDINNWLDALPLIERDTEHEIWLFDNPDRGDIIVFNPPSQSSKPYIKRIIGLPGETVEIRDGNVFINGSLLAEDYIVDNSTDCGQNNCGPLVVPDDSVFVLGDNRRNSSDSRVFGAVEIGRIIGKASVFYWPLDELGLMLNEDYPDSDQ